MNDTSSANAALLAEFQRRRREDRLSRRAGTLSEVQQLLKDVQRERIRGSATEPSPVPDAAGTETETPRRLGLWHQDSETQRMLNEVRKKRSTSTADSCSTSSCSASALRGRQRRLRSSTSSCPIGNAKPKSTATLGRQATSTTKLRPACTQARKSASELPSPRARSPRDRTCSPGNVQVKAVKAMDMSPLARTESRLLWSPDTRLKRWQDELVDKLSGLRAKHVREWDDLQTCPKTFAEFSDRFIGCEPVRLKKDVSILQEKVAADTTFAVAAGQLADAATKWSLEDVSAELRPGVMSKTLANDATLRKSEAQQVNPDGNIAFPDGVEVF